MRTIYQNDLGQVVNDLVVMSDSIQIAVRDATRALLDAELSIAERVISGDTRIDAMLQKAARPTRRSIVE